ncbi:hypothetical protein P167DRAFT_335980 [Morchella conica CCBAS932]|uniref:Uncharacterized protein n=1 Tax=Morchella conica CCBAS932 TaxID=1392247 RepID=A0A3N4KDR2_9PEZI|nr:hypothetical protein P167DRAFT_335980 [Morchella conica CCBAS932]
MDRLSDRPNQLAWSLTVYLSVDAFFFSLVRLFFTTIRHWAWSCFLFYHGFMYGNDFSSGERGGKGGHFAVAARRFLFLFLYLFF